MEDEKEDSMDSWTLNAREPVSCCTVLTRDVYVKASPDKSPPDTSPPDTSPPDTSPPDTNPPDTSPSTIQHLSSRPPISEFPPTQTDPDYLYPFSLAPEDFPERFYRLHRDENWRELLNFPPTLPHSNNSNSSLSSPETPDESTSTEINTPPHLSTPYNPPEHGWTASNTTTRLPTSPFGILAAVREHFGDHSSPTSIFVPGIWTRSKFSAISLFDNPDDAYEEGRQFGGRREGIKVFAIEGSLLKRGPGGYGRGSVVFCMEELLRRDSALCRLTEGRYGQRDRSMKGGRGLKGKAYLVVGLIPGTHNSPQISPANTISNASRRSIIKGEEDNFTVVDRSRVPSLPAASTHIPENTDFFDFEAFERAQEDTNTTLQTQTNFTRQSIPIPSARGSERTLFGWDLDLEEEEEEKDINPHFHSAKKDIRELRGSYRNRTLMRMEAISEDIGDTIIVDSSHTMHSPPSKSSSRPRIARKISQKLSPKNSIRKIISGARITRAGTFGRRSSSGEISNSSRFSLQSRPSSHFTMVNRKSSIEGSQNISIDTSDSRDGYSSEGSLSAGSDIPAVAVPKGARPVSPAVATPKRVRPVSSVVAEHSRLGSSNLHPNKVQKSSDSQRRDKGGLMTSPDLVMPYAVTAEDHNMEESSGDDEILTRKRTKVGSSPPSNNIPRSYLKTRQPIQSQTPKGDDFQNSVKLKTPRNNKEPISIVDEEWPLKNKEPLPEPNTIERSVQRTTVDKGTDATDFTNPTASNPHAKTTKPYHPVYDESIMVRRPSLLRHVSKPTLTQERKLSIPKLKKGEKVWAYKGVIAFGTREYEGKSKHCYLIEWEDPWAPTWQPKDQTDKPLKDDWARKKEAWDAQLRTKEGKKLMKEKKMKRILWEEEEKYLVEWTKDLRPEWVKKKEVGKNAVREFERRKRGWKFAVDGGEDAKDGEEEGDSGDAVEDVED